MPNANLLKFKYSLALMICTACVCLVVVVCGLYPKDDCHWASVWMSINCGRGDQNKLEQWEHLKMLKQCNFSLSHWLSAKCGDKGVRCVCVVVGGGVGAQAGSWEVDERPNQIWHICQTHHHLHHRHNHWLCHQRDWYNSNLRMKTLRQVPRWHLKCLTGADWPLEGKGYFCGRGKITWAKTAWVHFSFLVLVVIRNCLFIDRNRMWALLTLTASLFSTSPAPERGGWGPLGLGLTGQLALTWSWWGCLGWV